MCGRTCLVAAVLAMALAGAASGQTEDLRERYGTRSLEAANAIHRGLELMEQRKPKESLAALNEALKLDAGSVMALYQRGHAYMNMGLLDEGLADWKTVVEWSEQGRGSMLLGTDAAVNVGLSLGRLKQYPESNQWFTRAILMDPDDKGERHWKAYRNLAINLAEQGEFLAAAIAASTAREINSRQVESRMIEDLKSRIGNQRYARLLHVPYEQIEVQAREIDTELTRIDPVGAKIEADIHQILPDPRTNRIAILPRAADHFFLLRTGDAVISRKVPVGQSIRCGTVAEGRLFVATDGQPPAIREVDWMTGKTLRQWDLRGNASPASIAFCLSRRQAFFTVGHELHRLRLEDGQVEDLEIAATQLWVDPAEKQLWCWYHELKTIRPGGFETFIVGGRPVTVHDSGEYASLTRLSRYVITDRKVIMAEMYHQPPINSTGLSVSPDGRWVVLHGSFGKQGPQISPSADFSRAAGYVAGLDGPMASAINPVTGQGVMVQSADKLHAFHLAAPKAKLVDTGTCKFGPHCVWSGDGEFLVASGENGKGVSVWRNKMTPAEQKLASTWWKALEPADQGSSETAPTDLKPDSELQKFALVGDRAQVVARLDQAIKSGGTKQPLDWRKYPAYADPEAVKITEQASAEMEDDRAGLAIHILRQGLKEHPDVLPLRIVLGRALAKAGLYDEAVAQALQVVQTDAGRTDLTKAGLRNLADGLLPKGKKLEAIWCLAWALQLDRADPRTISQALPLLSENGMEVQAEALRKVSPSDQITDTRLSALPDPPETAKPIPAAELYESVVPSIVLITRGRSSGTGFCVGKAGVILTNDHVLSGSGPLKVHPYALQDGKVVRLPEVPASVILHSKEDDLAVLRIRGEVPTGMKPLPVALADRTRPGTKVFAIGNPGLGNQVLEQSISEGIVSSVDRKIDGNVYLQHTAAVNPGNSGGPLLDDHGRVVGVITLKAELENVSFAIPAGRIRATFAKVE